MGEKPKRGPVAAEFVPRESAGRPSAIPPGNSPPGGSAGITRFSGGNVVLRVLTTPVAAISALIFAVSGIRSRIVRTNLRLAGLKSGGKGARPLQFYRLRLGFSLARAVSDLIFASKLPEPHLHARSGATARALEATLETMRGGPSLLLTAHFGNWEAQAAAWRRRGVDLLGAARPLAAPAAGRALAALRARHGIRVVTRGVARAALRHLDAGGCFGLLWDQHAPDAARHGRFFGTPVTLDPLPFFLLARRPCPVHFGVLLPDGTLRLVPLLGVRDFARPGWEDRLARRYHRVLETLIRARPAHWHGVLHARFKLTGAYPEHRRGNQKSEIRNQKLAAGNTERGGDESDTRDQRFTGFSLPISDF